MDATTIEALKQLGPFAIVVMIAWAEIRFLPHVKRALTYVRATAKKAGVTPQDLRDAQTEESFTPSPSMPELPALESIAAPPKIGGV